MGGETNPGSERIRAAEAIATLSLATDLATGLPFEHGLESTIVAMRLADRLGVDPETAAETYYAGLLFYIGCTADAEVAAELFADDIHAHLTPALFGSRAEIMAAIARALAPADRAPPIRALIAARRLPRAAVVHRRHVTAICEVGEILSERLGLPARMPELFRALPERWDGKGAPRGIAADEIPLAVRIVHVARDASFQALLGGPEHAVAVVRKRTGGAFDPAIAGVFAAEAAEILAPQGQGSAWDQLLECEPAPRVVLDAAATDRALAAIGEFADLVSPHFCGHSAGVARLTAAAAEHAGLARAEVIAVRRAGLVHDLGRVAVAAGIWSKPGPLSADEWEQVRLHPYHCDRVLGPSDLLAELAPIATAHHERLDGSGYHRGLTAVALSKPARLLAAADAYHAMTEPRAHRSALSPEQATRELSAECDAGRLDADAVAAVLAAADQPVPRLRRPGGLSEREAEVVTLLARGLQTKQIAARLGISVKTADRHIQNAYAKLGVSTRAAAALLAMQHGLVGWGELPIASPAAGS